MATARKNKKGLKCGASCGHITNLKQSVFLWISMVRALHYRQEEWPVSKNVLKAKSPNLANWTVNKIFIVLFTI
jgi:hypothetical protein